MTVGRREQAQCRTWGEEQQARANSSAHGPQRRFRTSGARKEPTPFNLAHGTCSAHRHLPASYPTPQVAWKQRCAYTGGASAGPFEPRTGRAPRPPPPMLVQIRGEGFHPSLPLTLLPLHPVVAARTRVRWTTPYSTRPPHRGQRPSAPSPATARTRRETSSLPQPCEKMSLRSGSRKSLRGMVELTWSQCHRKYSSCVTLGEQGTPSLFSNWPHLVMILKARLKFCCLQIGRAHV